ncbi:hypothetical protein EZ428_04240 [Pedobacter frigiditerrae]|uniref:Putative auto-transporter adhesin head GIN domain-containing protein n=1 Tax=Pedobacter frigiditerrae TaxID=2530452 RepID=A0A4R0N2K7_9SPHI|nr:DUF2807 domain-containing protein [Pedobacter frigiditerrae]TCC93990.1 hypothetical protein EZ428_04240 [Pedobacter frigiditerrae]
MKTSIKTLFAAALALVVLTSSAFASTDVKNNNVTVLNQVKNISKIEVKGNVEVILVQAPVESVKVYDSYYSKNALVQQQDGVLRISSFQKETLSVVVYVRDLSSIEAGDNAQVKTYGKINFLSLAVKLSGNATADINASTISLYTSIKDSASLKLAGSTTDHYAVLSTQAKLNMGSFVAETSSVNSTATVIAKAKPVKQTLENLLIDDINLAK